MNTLSFLEFSLKLSFILYLFSVLIGLVARNSKNAMKISFVMTALASAILIPIPFIYGFLNVEPLRLGLQVLNISIPILIDALSSVLMLVISILSLASAIYSLSYMEYYEEIGMQGLFASLFALFSLSMLLVVLVDSTLWFLFMWEVMTLASYFLINWEYTDERVRRAALNYFVTMHFLSTLPLIVAIAVLVTITGADSFTDISIAIKNANPIVLVTIQTLLLLGFGAKAGAVPLHFWLPEAHPAAPSNVSALLSGAMIKVAVYGILRFCIYTLPMSSALGIAIALIGTLSLTVGTLTALKQTDAKRLLAYHSVGQMGYIWLGIGAGVALACQGNPLATVGIVAGLYHLVNHAAFKGLLFLSAGSILFRTKTRDLNALGGLAKFMPITSALTLIATLSIAGIPPFNGFVSKWLIYETTFLSNNGLIVFCGVMALFISAATLASFIKFYTSAFGGSPRIQVSEVPRSMLIGKAILASICVLFGVLPIVIVKLLLKASQMITGIKIVETLMVTPMFVSVTKSVFLPIFLLAALTILSLLSIAIAYPHRSTVALWACGSEVDPLRYRLYAKHYYIVYEEFIHALYELGKELSHTLGNVLKSLVQALCTVSIRIADALEGSGRAFVMFLYSIARRLHGAERFYLDEAIATPVIRAISGIARFFGWTVMRTDLVTFMAYSALFILFMSLLIIALILGVSIHD